MKCLNVIYFFPLLQAGVAYGGCLRGHLLEALELNNKVRSIYANQTNGRSEKIFRLLMTSERLGLLAVKNYDRKSLYYHRNSIPLFCDEFLPVKSFSEWSEFPRTLPTSSYQVFNHQNYANQLKKAIARKDVVKIKSLSLTAYKDLAKNLHFNCMQRHVIESIYRFAYFAPLHEEASIQQGLQSPLHLSLKMIKMQLSLMDGSAKIDQWSMPIQKSGIPIVCAEMSDLLEDIL